MRLADHPSLHLAYSMIVHPGVSLDDVEAAIREYLPPLKARFSPDAPFGVGLRLAGQASHDLLEGDRLDRFRTLLDDHGVYVVSIDGFAYGPLHGETVKADIHLPDWQDEERLGYTFRLGTILAKLLRDDIDQGGISTSPLGYKPWVDTGMPANWMVFTLNIIRVVQHLIRLREETGKLVHIDLEPGPDGVLGTGAELATFYETWLLKHGVAMLADRAGNDPGLAREQILDHVRVCLDTSHIALGYEDPDGLLDRFDSLGIRIGKVRVSSALQVLLPDDEVGRKRISNELAALDEPVNLHQVIQRNEDGSLVRYPDLPDALPAVNNPDAREWRVHVHVPVSMERYGSLDATRTTILEMFRLMREREVTGHLEIGTSMWDVLPDDLHMPLGEMISRELQWVLDHA